MNHRVSDQEFSYLHCQRCGLVAIEVIPPDLDRYYSASYHSIPTSITDLDRQASAEMFKLEIIGAHTSGRRLLEIGPSFGAFAHVARGAGYDIDVIEMDPDCCRFLRETVRVNVIESADPVGALAGAHQYDVIVMWQVFEHLQDPWATLRASAAALAPDGVLVIATPNPESLQFRFWGSRWTHLDAPRHLELIPLDVLRQRAEGCGLRLVNATTTDPGSVGWNAFGWAYSMAALTSRDRPRSVLEQLGRFVGVWLRPIERTGWRGASYTAVFRRVS